MFAMKAKEAIYQARKLFDTSKCMKCNKEIFFITDGEWRHSRLMPLGCVVAVPAPDGVLIVWDINDFSV